ncbi:MAG: hypothetical protein KDD82_06350 [Planctomycetes bacterium]|nr:hypothetical protein [Planctomycetota bacterium]
MNHRTSIVFRPSCALCRGPLGSHALRCPGCALTVHARCQAWLGGEACPALACERPLSRRDPGSVSWESLVAWVRRYPPRR